jgi:hypothetical protein
MRPFFSSNAFALRATHFLCRRKESKQRKRLFPDQSALADWNSNGFSDSPSWLGWLAFNATGRPLEKSPGN